MASQPNTAIVTGAFQGIGAGLVAAFLCVDTAKIETHHEHSNTNQQQDGVNRYDTLALLTVAPHSSHQLSRAGLCRGIVHVECRSLLSSRACSIEPGYARHRWCAVPNTPEIAPIGTRIGKYMDVPESAKGPAIDPAKGYRIQELGKGLYMVTDNAYQSMFMVYESGGGVIDAPPSYAGHIHQAIAEVTDKPIIHLVYSHSRIEHVPAELTDVGVGFVGDPIVAKARTFVLQTRVRHYFAPLL
jgi:hypothetical protein